MLNLSEKELTVIERIGNNGGRITQRQIAVHTGLSLGLTNLILKRLARKGYIKVRRLTPKRMHYILTRKGVMEKARKSYRYVCRAIGEMRRIEDTILQLLLGEYRKGNRVFGVVGDGELQEVVGLCSRNITDIKIIKLDKDVPVENADGIDVILNCKENFNYTAGGIRAINLIDYIARRA